MDHPFIGARLCPKGQPQRVDNTENFGWERLLRLVCDTAALRCGFENAP
jgi:hypothetical protein